eukprot:3698930-Amphidinium_carterae.1
MAAVLEALKWRNPSLAAEGLHADRATVVSRGTCCGRWDLNLYASFCRATSQALRTWDSTSALRHAV